MKKYAVFLGAGASASCSAPTQNNLFKEYFKARRSSRRPYEHDLERELATYFKFLFGIDVDHDDLDLTKFPTFEEAIGVLDIAISKNEAFKNFEGGSASFNSKNRLTGCREYLICLMGSILHDKLHQSENNHLTLIENLQKTGLLNDCIFISTNYDILIDNAISAFESILYPDISLYYGFDFVNITRQHDAVQIPLYKLHGSLNWLFCPSCNTMTSTRNEKGVIKLIRPLALGKPQDVLCPKCEGLLKDVIVPPTYFKQYSNYFLNSVWFNAEKSLRDVNKIVFCGYSFPDADMHIKYLLKRIETNHNGPLDIIVHNNHPGKDISDKVIEENSYNRFFRSPVNYTEKCFEDFIQNLDGLALH